MSSVPSAAAPLSPAARKLLDVAGELFFERGITGVGVALVAEEAGVTKKTLYDRFGSKEGLVVAYLQDRLNRYQAHVSDRLETTRVAGIDCVRGVFDALETWVGDSSRGCGMINAYAELSSHSRDAADIVRAEKQWTRELFERILTNAQIPSAAELARQLAIIHAGAIVEQAAGGSPTAIADARALAVRLVRDRSAP